VLVYVGAVAILAVFAIMTTASAEEEESSRVRRISPAMVSGGLIAAAVFGVLTWAIARGGFGSWPATSAPDLSVQEIGKALMQGFALPLEVMGLLLTAALVGAVIVAMTAKGESR
jgi:NADH-quinone oxidoreductase subunit J